MRMRWFVAALATGAVLTAAAVSAMDNLPKTPPTPADNPTTVAKVELGKQLFFDPRLSRTGTVSCNSCHNVMEAGDDDRATSVGVEGKLGARSSPTVWNAAYLPVQFWDGRALTLEEQAMGPMVNPLEMGMADHNLVIQRIGEIPGYQESFRMVFGQQKPITIDNVAKAIAAYERTLVTSASPYDHYQGGNRAALSASAVRGMKLVESVGCRSCHSGPMFAGPLEPGQGFFMKFPLKDTDPMLAAYKFMDDPGRASATKNEADQNTWRVAPWRNVALTAPYFHNGSVATLHEAVQVMAVAQLDRRLEPGEVADIVEFMGALTGDFPKQTMPRLPVLPNRTLIR